MRFSIKRLLDWFERRSGALEQCTHKENSLSVGMQSRESASKMYV